MTTFSKAINILAENVYDIKKKQRINSVQRRNQTVDMYGYELTASGTSSQSAILGVSVSQDMIYYSRFEFKVVISNSSSTSFTIKIDGIDVTAYFKAQFGGSWLSGNGIYPNKGTANYDVLKAVGYMNEVDRNTVLEPGYKEIEVIGNGNFDVKLYMYMKYSHANR